MDKTDALTEEALKLPPDDRAAIAHRLIDSLDSDDELPNEWKQELLRRSQLVKDGATKLYDAHEAVAQLRDELK